jgi:hypothetical protein
MELGELKKEQVNFLCGFFGRYSIDSPEVLEAYAVIDSYSESMGRPMGKMMYGLPLSLMSQAQSF